MPNRAYQTITLVDLQRLSEIASDDRNLLFARYPKYTVYQQRVACVALCQGAALHFIDGQTGIKDFDVWTFYWELPFIRFPPRRRARAKFGPSHFTNWSGRVDLIGRSVPWPTENDSASMLRNYLANRATRSARFLAEKGAVLIDPFECRGEIVWRGGIQ
jgi:hypothetical protein